MNVRCKNCFETFGILNEHLCFYKADANPKNIQLIAKPELQMALLATTLKVGVHEDWGDRIHCTKCEAKVGMSCISLS